MTRKSNNNINYDEVRAVADSKSLNLRFSNKELLKKYEDQFNIIVKDLPNASDLWKNVLKDIDAKNISYISNEFSFTDLLKISDLNLFSVLSTTFFESLYFDADIFFIEDKDEIDSNICENKLKNELFYFSDTDQYIKELDAYLNEGKFYKGNLHTHSTNSDGVLSPEIVCKKYKQAINTRCDLLRSSNHSWRNKI